MPEAATLSTILAKAVAYYRFNTGALITDSKGAFTLTNNNAVGEGVGKFGVCADFGTTNTNKSLTANSDLGIIGGAVSISAWVKLSAEIASGTWGISCIQDGGNKVVNGIYYDYNSGTRRLVFDRTKNYVANDRGYYNVTLGTSDWYHICLTYDTSNVRGYVNGVLVAGPVASSGFGTTNGTDAFGIGCYRGTDTGAIAAWLSGLIDDVLICNQALSAAEVMQLFKLGVGGTSMFLVF